MPLFEFCYVAFGIIDLYIVLAGSVFDMISKKNRILFFLFIAITTWVANIFLPSITTYLVLVSSFILLYYIAGRKIIYICLALFNYLFSIVINYVTLIVLERTLGITEIETITEYYLFYYLFLTILLLISSYGIRQIYNHFIKNSIQLPTITGIFTLIYLAICALLFVYNYTYEEMLGFPQDVVQVNTSLFTLFFIITGIFIAILMYVLRRDARLQAQNIQYESLQNYTAQVEALYQNIRGFKHDYVNILTTMHFYIENEDWEALKTYYETEILPTSNSFQDSTQVLGQLSNLQIPELKSLFYNKFVKALELGINVQLEIRKPIDSISVKNVDIARVIGIYLDNAIEALNEPDLEAGQRNLTVAIIREEDGVSFIIQNNCKEFTLNLHKLGSLSYSTKGEHRGMGLHLAAQTLHRYKNIQKDTTYENHVFTQALKIFDE